MNNKVTYRQQFTRCGKQRCRKCREGGGHGPYWYAYWSENGRTVSKYIGTRLPPDIEQAQQALGDAVKEPVPGVQSQLPPSPSLRIYLLGQFRIERKNGQEWETIDNRTWHRRRARALLGCLLSSPGRRLGREQVMELLWPDLDIDVAVNRLNGAVHELRQILEPEIARPANSRMLRLERDILELADTNQIWVDAEAFEQLLKEANTTNDPDQAEYLLEEANSLYKGGYLLEELYSEWAAPRRDALQRAWVGLLLNLTNLRVEQGAYASALETLDRLRIADPTNETALQRLMILLTQLDRRGESLQVYRQHAALLQRDYESEPLPETTELYEALRQGHIPTLYAIRTPTIAKETNAPPPPTISSQLQQDLSTQEFLFARPLFQSGRHNQSPLIGRDQELEEMRQAIRAIEALPIQNELAGKDPLNRTLQTVTSSSRSRRPHFILLRGEAGIGKTRLAEEISLEAYTRGWAVVWSRSYEQEGAIPYHPWTELLQTLLKGATTLENLQNITTSNGSSQAIPLHIKLERLSVLLPELIDATSWSALRSTPTLPHEQERLHLWEAASSLLGTLSKIHPLLLVLDDLHWTDESSLELLTYLTHHLQDQRIVLIGTCRDGELAPQHKLRTLIADLRREQAIVTISVNPLTHSQIGTLVAHLPKDTVQSIQTQAFGNPFFAEELARYAGMSVNEQEALISPVQNKALDLPPSLSPHLNLITAYKKPARDTTYPQRSLPEPIAAVLERRLNRLSTGCQTLLSKAAILGGSFELSQLLPMANEQDEDTVLDLLEEALHAGLLTEEGIGAHITYHFWHPLIISHLYERLSAARRAQLHRRAAEAIQASHTFSQPEKVAATIVYHLTRGGGNPKQIAYYAELAGNQAYSLAAYSEAQQYYLQALQSQVNNKLASIEDTEIQIQHITTQITKQSLSDPLHFCKLLEHVAECSMVLGNYEEARHLYESILTIRTTQDFRRQTSSPAENDIDKEEQQEAQIQALLWREMGNTWAATGDYTRAYECYACGKEVIAQAGVTTGAAWACLHLQFGEMLRLQGRYQEAQHYLQEALATLERVVSSPASGHARTNAARQQAGVSNILINDLDKGLQTRTERALIGDPLEIGYAHERLGIVVASVGQLNEALQHLHITLSIFEQSELVSEMARVCGNLGVVYATKGAQAEAYDYMQRSLKLAERTGDLPNMTFIMGNLGDMAHRAGNLHESERWFQRSLALAEHINDRERISWFNVELAAVQQDLGNLQDAAIHLQRAITIGRAIQSSRCIRYALVGLGSLRIVEATTTYQVHDPRHNSADEEKREIASACQRLFHRAKSTLQRATSSGELEVEAIIDGRYLLATIYFLQNQQEIAYDLALQTLKEAQDNEIARMIGRTYRLLGRIHTAQGHFAEADQCFEQALHICHEHELRLDYARALHNYGISLMQRGKYLPHTTQEMFYQKGISHLREARSIFEQCHAMIDFSWVEQILSTSEQRNATGNVSGR